MELRINILKVMKLKINPLINRHLENLNMTNRHISNRIHHPITALNNRLACRLLNPWVHLLDHHLHFP
jgi:hypothetical protein